jgi:hypothetical protein
MLFWIVRVRFSKAFAWVAPRRPGKSMTHLTAAAIAPTPVRERGATT